MIKLLKRLNKIQLLKLIAVIALSDGSINQGKECKRELRLVTHKNSIQQHELFNYLSKKVLDKEIVSYKYGFVESYN